MRKLWIVLLCSSIFVTTATANDILSGISGIMSGVLDSFWDKFNDKTSSVAGVCYVPDYGKQDLDVCSVLAKLESVNTDVCSFVPSIPGFKKKTQEIGFDGLVALCRAKTQEFKNIISQGASDSVAGIVDYNDEESLALKLPNGMSYEDYLSKWNFEQVLRQRDSLVGRYSLSPHANPFAGAESAAAFTDNQKVLFMMKEYTQSPSFSGGNITSINENSLENALPATLKEYEQQRDERAKQLAIGYNQSSIVSLSSSIQAALSGKELSQEAATLEANRIVAEAKKEVKNAKAQEIQSQLRLQRKDTDFAFPLASQASVYRADLRPKVVAYIREQILRESSIIAAINQKWNNYEQTLDLIAEKAVILNEKFDEEEAKKEIEEIINAAGGN